MRNLFCFLVVTILLCASCGRQESPNLSENVAPDAAGLADDAGLEKIVFLAQWTPQSQFAGFYIAMKKGFFRQEGLDVEVRHFSAASSQTPLSMLRSDSVQIVEMQLLGALMDNNEDEPIVNVMQLSQNCGLRCVSHTPVASLADMNGKTIARWKSGFNEIITIIEKENNLDIKWVDFLSSGTNMYMYNAVDAMLSYSYNEFIELELASGKINSNQIVDMSRWGYNYPEDGLYVTEKYLSEHRETVARFVRAVRRGWDYVRENRDEALDCTLKVMNETGTQGNRAHQRMMLDEILRLQVNPKTGKADYRAVSREQFDEICAKLTRNNLMNRKVNYEDFVYETSK